MEATKEMESLLNRIYMPYVFYFPKELFPNLSEETKRKLREYRFFEDLCIMKPDGKVGALGKPFNILEMYKKEDILEGNIFQLLEMKDRLNGETFGFLLDKYLSNVKTWIYAYDWLLGNFDKQIPETSKNEKSLFEYQCTVLDNHLTKLNQKFKFNFSKTATANLMDVLSKNKNAFPFDRSMFNNLKGGLKRIDPGKTVKATKQGKKQLLLTEREADGFLLRTVFNLKT